MTDRKLCFSPTALVKRLAVLVVSVVVLFGFSQTAALANSNPLSTALNAELAPNSLIALAASSRFAAQAESEGQEPIISEAKLNEKREQRREWQSEVSAAAVTEPKTEPDESLGELIKDKLNLEEIVEENEIVDSIKNP